MSARTARRERAAESDLLHDGVAVASSPWDPRTWLPRLTGWAIGEKHATYSFAAFRIVYGLIVLMVLVTNAADRAYVWGVGSKWLDLELGVNPYPWFFGILFPKDNPFLFDLSYGALAILAVLFTIGWRTRIVTPFLLLFWVSLSTNSNLVNNGGDTVMRITLLFAVFADLSQRFSVDAWLRDRRAARGLKPARRLVFSWWPSWLTSLLHNTALVLCAYQITLVYVRSASLKLQGPEWLNGTAPYYSVVLDNFRPFPLLSDLTFQVAFFVHVAGYIALFTQLLFPLLLLWRPSRIFALVAITGMHLSIALLLGLWPFSLAMIALDFLFIRDRTWLAGFAWGRRWLAAIGALRRSVAAGAGVGGGVAGASGVGVADVAGADAGADVDADAPQAEPVTVGSALTEDSDITGEAATAEPEAVGAGAGPSARGGSAEPRPGSRRFVHAKSSGDDTV